MSGDLGKLIAVAMENAGFLDQMATLGIEYQANNITAERFSKRVCEILAEYQKRCQAYDAKMQAAK